MVSSVVVKIVVKSTNEHCYHGTVYSYSKADWDGLRDYFRHVPWLDIFKHDATLLLRKYLSWSTVSVKAPLWFISLHIATIISISTIGMRLFCDFHCQVARSNYAETTRRSVASQLIGSRGIWSICNNVLNSGSLQYLFNGPEVLTTSTDKAIP